MENIPLYGVAAKHTNQTCQMGDAKSRVSRDEFIYTRTFHADIKTAWNILYRAAGKVVLRWSGQEGNKPTSFMLRAIHEPSGKSMQMYLSI